MPSMAVPLSRNIAPLDPVSLVQPRAPMGRDHHRPTQAKRRYRHFSETMNHDSEMDNIADEAFGSLVDIHSSVSATNPATVSQDWSRRKPSGRVMRGSIAAVEQQQRPEPMTPPGEVAGVSFAPHAELVFVEDEFNRSRRDRHVQKNLADSLDASGTLFKGGFYTTYAARQSRCKAPLAPILGDSPPALLAEGVACPKLATMDSLDTFHAEMSVGKDDPHTYPYYYKARKSFNLTAGITERFGLGRSAQDLPLPLHSMRSKVMDPSRSMSSRNLADVIGRAGPLDNSRLKPSASLDPQALDDPLNRVGPNSKKGGFTFERPRTMASRAL